MTAFLVGFVAVLRGAPLLARTPALRRLAVWPTVLSLLLLAGLVWASVHYGPGLVDRYWSPAEGWLGGLQLLARALAVVLLLAVSGALFFVGSNLIAQPFVDALSAATDTTLGSSVVAPAGWRALLREWGWVVGDVLLDLAVYLIAQGVVLVAWLVPGVGGGLHLVLAWLVNAWFAGAGMVCSPLVRRGTHGLARWRRMRALGALVLGIGAGSLLVLLVPLAQLLTLPIAVVGATLALVEQERREAGT
jgi:CysZ protein